MEQLLERMDLIIEKLESIDKSLQSLEMLMGIVVEKGAIKVINGPDDFYTYTIET